MQHTMRAVMVWASAARQRMRDVKTCSQVHSYES